MDDAGIVNISFVASVFTLRLPSFSSFKPAHAVPKCSDVAVTVH